MDTGKQQDPARCSLCNLTKYAVDGLHSQLVRDSLPHKACRLRLIKAGLSEHLTNGLPVEIDLDESHLLG